METRWFHATLSSPPLVLAHVRVAPDNSVRRDAPPAQKIILGKLRPPHQCACANPLVCHQPLVSAILNFPPPVEKGQGLVPAIAVACPSFFLCPRAIARPWPIVILLRPILAYPTQVMEGLTLHHWIWTLVMGLVLGKRWPQFWVNTGGCHRREIDQHWCGCIPCAARCPTQLAPMTCTDAMGMHRRASVRRPVPRIETLFCYCVSLPFLSEDFLHQTWRHQPSNSYEPTSLRYSLWVWMLRNFGFTVLDMESLTSSILTLALSSSLILTLAPSPAIGEWIPKTRCRKNFLKTFGVNSQWCNNRFVCDALSCTVSRRSSRARVQKKYEEFIF